MHASMSELPRWLTRAAYAKTRWAGRILSEARDRAIRSAGEPERVAEQASKRWAEPDDVSTCVKEVRSYTGILKLPLAGRSSSTIPL